jgi:hypothetical protein
MKSVLCAVFLAAKDERCSSVSEAVPDSVVLFSVALTQTFLVPRQRTAARFRYRGHCCCCCHPHMLLQGYCWSVRIWQCCPR